MEYFRVLLHIDSELLPKAAVIAWSWEFLEAGQSLGWPSLERSDGARVGQYEKQLLGMAIVCLGQLVTSN